ncbi:MAG: FTR1 family protein [Actinomycetota bacterium]|nr:FTR1 family protein [Actinomycetota bacterium]
MLANYLIGLREGLEAALVVGILVAYLVKTGNRHRLLPIWVGVGIAVAFSLLAGALLTFTSRSLSFRAQEMFGGVASIVAVAFVTWMIFWMRRTARHLKGELQGRLDAALVMGPWALAGAALLAVGREGLETALFIWTAVQATGSSATPVTGAFLGLLTAVVLGYLIYRRSIQLNLAKFFTYTGGALIVVAAGVLAYGVHDLQEAGLLTSFGLDRVVFDATSILPPSSWWGSLFKGLFSISAAPTRLELLAWISYLVPVMVLFLWPTLRRTPAPQSEPAGAPAPASGVGAR